MLDKRLLAQIGSFSDPGHRTKASKKLAEALGAEDLIIFSRDPVLGIMLPSPGFPQTLPEGYQWKKFISSCSGKQHSSDKLVSPYTLKSIKVHGFEATDGSLLILLGENPNVLMAIEVVSLLPLIVSALANERISIISKGEIEVESLYSERAKVLADALDKTRRSLESELRKSHSILNSITDAFFALDTEWNFVDMNGQAEELLQKKRESILGRNIWELYPEAKDSNFNRQYEKAMTSQSAVFFEEFFVSQNAWYEVRAYPAKDGLAVYFNNIHERKKAAEELLQSKRWFETTLRSIGDGVIVVNSDRTVSFLNLVAEELTGWKLTEALGKSMDDVFKIINEKTRKLAKNPVDRVLKEGRVVGMANHTALISRSGTEYVIEDSAAPIRNSNGEITGVVLVFRDVTDEYAQKTKLENTYQELLSERSRLEAILQQMPEGVMIADPSGKLILRNSQMDIMLGGFLPCKEISEYGQYKGYKANGQAYLPHEWPLARSLTKGEVIHGEEIELERFDGGRSILSISSAPIRDQDNRIVAGVVIHHDITGSKKVEAELRYQSYLTKTITDNAASALFMMDKEGKPTFMNPAAKKITGYNSLEEISDKPLHYAVHWKKPDGSHYPMEECPIDNAQAELKSVQNQEEVFCSKEGRLFPVSFSVSPLEKKGKVIGSVLEFRDITEQKEFEHKLQQAIKERDKSLQTLETINKVGQRLTAELDLDKLVQQVTDDGTRLTEAQFGAFFYNTTDENGNALLLNVVSGVPKEKFAKFPTPRATAVFHPTFVGAGTVRSGDITKDPRYGQNAPYKGLPQGHLPVRSYLAVSVISRTGEVIGGLFFGHEKENVFTEQSEKIVEGLAAQAAVAMDNARLYGKVQESVRARDEFLSIASHELKTPLTSLKLQAQMQMRFVSRKNPEAYTKENVDEFVALVDKQIKRLTRLIDDMLDVSRIRSGRMEIIKSPIDISRLTTEVVQRLKDLFLNMSYEVPELHLEKDAVTLCDPLRIEQVLVNLLTNAVRYGNGNPISIITEKHAKSVRLIVQDRGIGIKKGDEEKIFDRFERSINANEVSGLGLGLFISKEIITAHGGRIWVESDLGKGSKFIFDLPKADENA